MNLKFFSDPGDAENFEPFPIMFSRASVAYEGNGASLQTNQPGFIGGEKGVYGLGVYEQYSNILTSSLSQEFNEAWTSGTLNGTYTITIKSGGGSITLSGGATGTVTSGNSLTFTVTSSTVTFTPSGSCLNTIIINKPYPLPWIIGGTTRQPESCIIQKQEWSNFFNPKNGCVELLVYSTKSLETKNSIIFEHGVPGQGNNNRFYLIKHSNGTWIIDSLDNSGQISTINTPYTGNVGDWTVATINVLPNRLSLTVKGVTVNRENPYLPDMMGVLTLLTTYSLGTHGNTFIKSIVFSKPRPEEERVIRQKFAEANGYYPIDDKVTAFMDLTTDLKAYRRSTL